ncbi:MAG: sodium:solute symporter [Planctomycetota bacterium]|nr:sodium:solute symporter [Planctomycetota bacterium]
MYLAQGGFVFWDWLILVAYLALVVVIGIWAGRKRSGETGDTVSGGGGDDYFLASRSMPMWAVAISILATSQSAATFVGGPQQAYAGNLTYLMANLGGLLAVILVAVLFIPAFYKHNVTSIYELLGHRFGPLAQRSAGAMFLIGRIFASGARLFIVAFPFSLVAFGSIEPTQLIISIAIIACGATFYTMIGGIRAVIWTDVLQAVVYITTLGIALVLLWQKMPIDTSQFIEALRSAPEGDKLQMLDVGLNSKEDFAKPYTLWAILIGMTLFNLAAYGTDQDLTQRMLTCKSSRKGSWSVILSNLIGWPIVFLFLVMGLMLYVFYSRPDLMGASAPGYEIDDSRKVFLEFILHEMPTGLRGLMMAGLFAAAMSSMDSALNAMASTTIADFYRPLRKHKASSQQERTASRWAVGFWAVALAAFACFCVFWQQAGGDTLINFALGVMVFAYSGLLSVFLTALLTTRGNQWSVMAALAMGFVSVLLMQDKYWAMWAPSLGLDFTIAFPWKMLVATALSFGVCILGTRKTTT